MKPNKRRIIGLTGTIASGKSTVAAYLRDKKGAAWIDADQVSRQVTDELAEAIAAEFGQQVLEDGKLVRSRLAEQVFHDPVKLQKLNALLHPAICSQIRAWIEAQTADVLVIEAIELMRSELKDMITELWVVYAEPAVRAMRMQKARGYSEEDALARIQSQLADDVYLAYGGKVINGGGSMAELYAHCDKLLEE